jgi:hypothetical protein
MRKRTAFVAALLVCGLLVISFLVRGGTLVGQTAAGAQRNQIARSEYMVTAGGCHDCHTSKVRDPSPK